MAVDPLSDSAFRILQKLKDLQGADRRNVQPCLEVRRYADRSPATSDLFTVDDEGGSGELLFTGILDEQLNELSARKLVTLSENLVQLSEPGVEYETGSLARRIGQARKSRAAFVIGLLGSVASIIGLALVLQGNEGSPQSADDDIAAPSTSRTSARDSVSTTSGTAVVTTGPSVASPVPQSRIDALPPLVSGRVTVAGSSAYDGGVHHVEAVLQKLDEEIYWNPSVDGWQKRFQVFTLPVDEMSDGWFAWKLDKALPAGEYRFRVWARGADGVGEDGEVLMDFSVPESVGDVEVGLTAEAQAAALPDPAGVPDSPKVRMRTPVNGSLIPSPVRIRAVAEDGDGIVNFALVLQDDADRYWNFTSQVWQDERTYFEVGEPEILVPALTLGPGTFRATAKAVDSSGAVGERTNVFSVWPQD
jgi:hypothetical protein